MHSHAFGTGTRCFAMGSMTVGQCDNSRQSVMTFVFLMSQGYSCVVTSCGVMIVLSEWQQFSESSVVLHTRPSLQAFHLDNCETLWKENMEPEVPNVTSYYA